MSLADDEVDNTRDLEHMVSVLVAQGSWAYGKDTHLMEVAREWLQEGFNAEDANEWLTSGCFDPKAAREFDDALIAPDEVGGTTLETTLAYRVSSHELTVTEALQAVQKG